MGLIKKTLCSAISLLFAGSFLQAPYNHMPVQTATQEQQKQPEEQGVHAGFKPIFYRKNTVPMLNEQGEQVLDEQGNLLTTEKISRDISLAYLLDMGYIYEIIVGAGDRISFWLNNEKWALEEKHREYKSELFRAILKELNGDDFNPDKLTLDERIYVVDLDRDGVIVLNKNLNQKISGWQNIPKEQVRRDGSMIYITLSDDNILEIEGARGKLLSPEQVYKTKELREQYKKEKEELEQKVKK